MFDPNPGNNESNRSRWRRISRHEAVVREFADASVISP